MTDKLDVEGMREALERAIWSEVFYHPRITFENAATYHHDEVGRTWADARRLVTDAASAILSLPQFSALLARVEELEGFAQDVEDGLTWNSSLTQSFDRIASVVRDFRRARSALSPSTLAKEPSDER